MEWTKKFQTAFFRRWCIFSKCFKINRIRIERALILYTFRLFWWLCGEKLFVRTKKAARSPWSLKLRSNIKNFKLVFFSTEKSFLKEFNVVRITTEKDLLWYTTPPSPMITWGTQFCVQNKKKKKYNYRKQFPPYFSNGGKNELITQPRDHTLVENKTILSW